MTTVVVLTDSPGATQPLPALVDEILTPEEATQLYESMLIDVCRTVRRGGGDLLVNVRPATDESAEEQSFSAVRELLEANIEEMDAVRFEPQVGETYAGRVGNSLTHLLEVEDENSVAVVDPTVAMLGREHVGNLLMNLRTSQVVLGPAPGGRVYCAGFTAPIDFQDCFEPPAVLTLTARATAAAAEISFLPMLPVVETAADLATVVSLIRARRLADRVVPPNTTTMIESLGLEVNASGAVIRADDR